MRRRFGRRRGGDGRTAIDAGVALARLCEEGIVAARALEPLDAEGVPRALAAVGAGETEDGKPLLVAFAPRSAGDAVLAALAVAGERAAAGAFVGGLAIAVAPVWTAKARRRLALAAPTSFACEGRAAPTLAEVRNAVEAEPAEDPERVSVEQVAAQLADPAERELFGRAALALAGLAAKHGGAVRGAGRSVELVLQARRVASLSRDARGLALETHLPRRASDRIEDASLADALDRLEGQLRKRLSDRRVRDGEEGLRERAMGELAASAGLRALVRWPLPTGGAEVLDFLALDAEGRPVAGAIRRRLGLEELGPILDATLALRAALPLLTAGAPPPVQLQTPRLLLAAESFDDAAMHALGEISLEVSRVSLGAARLAPEVVSEGREPAAGARRESSRRRSRGRGRRRRPAEAEALAPAQEPPAEAAEPEARPFDEVTAFDLDDGLEPERSRGRRRRGGRRRREGRRPAATREEAEAEPEEASEEASELAEAPEPVEEASLADEALGGEGAEEPAYDDEAPAEEPVSEVEAMRSEREARRRARVAKTEPELEERARPERPRRAVVVAHADRSSIASALLLAREVRLLEGLWIYPQAELMTFFRSVATDLRENTPIFVVGFTASPARDTLQAASLYRGRITWFDHHRWPPEDLEGMRSAIGEESLAVEPDLESPLALVLAECTRRSRFSDKLVDLFTARFSEHDFTRWGRLWWWRIGELAGRAGERRAEIESLLAGRPSDLAREAATLEMPPPPAELAYVAERDFALAHFGGWALVLVPVPAERDPHMAARLARERYRAQLSLAWQVGEDVVVLGGDDASGRRSLDLESVAEHLVNKHEWIEPLPGADHVARVRVRDLAAQPERIDVVVAEIAMGRSILEG